MTTLQDLVQSHRDITTRGIGTMLCAAWFALSNALARRLRAIERETEYRRAERVLRSMPDSMLKDIGLPRGAIRSRVRGLPD